VITRTQLHSFAPEFAQALINIPSRHTVHGFIDFQRFLGFFCGLGIKIPFYLRLAVVIVIVTISWPILQRHLGLSKAVTALHLVVSAQNATIRRKVQLSLNVNYKLLFWAPEKPLHEAIWRYI